MTEKLSTFSTFFAMGASLSWVERDRTPKLRRQMVVRGRRGERKQGGGGGGGGGSERRGNNKNPQLRLLVSTLESQAQN